MKIKIVVILFAFFTSVFGVAETNLVFSGSTVITENFEAYKREWPSFCHLDKKFYKTKIEVYDSIGFYRDEGSTRFIRIELYPIENESLITKNCVKGRHPQDYDKNDFPEAKDLKAVKTSTPKVSVRQVLRDGVNDNVYVADLANDLYGKRSLKFVYVIDEPSAYLKNAKVEIEKVNEEELLSSKSPLVYNFKEAAFLETDDLKVIKNVLNMTPKGFYIGTKGRSSMIAFDLNYLSSTQRDLVKNHFQDPARFFAKGHKVDAKSLEIGAVWGLVNSIGEIVAIVGNVDYFPRGATDSIDGCSLTVYQKINDQSKKFKVIHDQCY